MKIGQRFQIGNIVRETPIKHLDGRASHCLILRVEYDIDNQIFLYDVYYIEVGRVLSGLILNSNYYSYKVLS